MNSDVKGFLTFLIIAGLAVLLIWLYFHFFKIPKIKNLTFVDGGLGAGKTFYSVQLAVRLYKREIRRYKIRKVLLKPFAKCQDKKRLWGRLGHAYRHLEEPVLYSNIPLKYVKHAKLTIDILRREKRVAARSVVLIDDISLVADQMMYKDKKLAKELSIFFKLWRHESHGGYIVANSQTTSDLIWGFKYALSDYLYIHHGTNFPFVRVLKLQEMAYSADKDGSSIVNNRNEDIEETMKMVFCWKKYFKYYDSYCYSILTDGLEVYDKQTYLEYWQTAKTADLLTLDDFTRSLLKGGKHGISEAEA